MTSKEEIFDLINKFELDKAFEELNKFFLRQNDSLNTLINEFVSRPDNFNTAQFMTRLKIFINTNYHCQPSKNRPHPEIDFYDVLCELDFKIQTLNFQRIYKNKKIAAFLLHGESDEKGSDVNWLYHQLLYKEGLVNDKYITIDFGSKLGGSFERLLEEFFIRFEIDTNTGNRTRQIAQLRSKIESKLNIDHFVCIIKSPDNILNNEAELCKLFTDFLSFMDNQIVQENHNNSFILLFLEGKLADYKLKDNKYFFWFSENQEDDYPLNVVKCPDVKIIDLAPIRKIKEMDITEWIKWSLLNPAIYNKVSGFDGKEKEILKEGANPFQVIKRICSDLNIKFEDRWIN
jgi:hypothetical protein